MQQELIELLEEIIQYWYPEDFEALDRAEALIEKAKNNAPAVPQGIPVQEVIDAIEAWKSAWLKVPPFADRVNKATREAITISHNSLFLLLQSAQQAQRMPDGCPTPTGCGPHGCHGDCIAATPAPAPAQEPETALQKFTRFKVAETEGNPVEMLRAFCAFAMNSQDWFDVEPFFDLVREAMASRTAVAPSQEAGLTDVRR